MPTVVLGGPRRRLLIREVKQLRHAVHTSTTAMDPPVDLVADLANLLVLLGDEVTLALLDIPSRLLAVCSLLAAC